MPVFVLNDDDADILQRLIDRERNRPQTGPQRNSSETQDREGLIFPKSLIAVVKPVEYDRVEIPGYSYDPDAGDAGLDPSGVNPKNDDIPAIDHDNVHGGFCQFQFIAPTDGVLNVAGLEPMTRQVFVYNLSKRKAAIGEPILAYLTQDGSWVALGGSTRVKGYVEGVLVERMSELTFAKLALNFPPGTGTGTDPDKDEEYVMVYGRWFDAEAGESIGAIWYEGGGYYVAIAKQCPPTAGTGTGSGTMVLGGGGP